MSQAAEKESVFSRRRRLHRFIRNGDMGAEVIKELLPFGEALLYEKQLWDYKLELPTLPFNRPPSEMEKREYQSKMAEVVKDAVSFYNSYGGYLLIGIRNNP